MKKEGGRTRSGGSRATNELTLGLVQMAMGDDQDANISKAVTMVAEAARRGASLVCLPELFASRYFPQDRGSKPRAEPVPGPTTRRLAEAARESNVALVGGSLYEKAPGGRLYNTSVVFDENGRVLGKYRKVQVPQDESFYEKDYFSSGKTYKVFRTTSADGGEETEGDWEAAWEAVQRGHAISNSMIVAAVNRVGREGRMSFWGGSFVCDQFGRVLARADEREQVLLATCDLRLGKQVEEGWGFLRNRKPATYRKLT